jgi:hypothetical protein
MDDRIEHTCRRSARNAERDLTRALMVGVEA